MLSIEYEEVGWGVAKDLDTATVVVIVLRLVENIEAHVFDEQLVRA